MVVYQYPVGGHEINFSFFELVKSLFPLCRFPVVRKVIKTSSSLVKTTITLSDHRILTDLSG
jgi:hypothetical protein